PADLAGYKCEELVRWATTDADGRYALRVGPGEYEFGTSPLRRQQLTVRAEEVIERNIQINRQPRRLLSGLVVAQAADGRPLTGAVVQGLRTGPGVNPAYTAITDERGRFEVERWPEALQLYARDGAGTLAGFAPVPRGEDAVKVVLR